MPIAVPKVAFLVTFGTTIGTYRYDFPSLDRFNDWLYISGKPAPSYRQAYVLCGSSTCPCGPLLAIHHEHDDFKDCYDYASYQTPVVLQMLGGKES